MDLEDILKRDDLPKDVKDLLIDMWKEKELTEKTIDSLMDTYFIFNVEDGQPLKWNRSFSEISGYSDDEIRSMKPVDFFPKENTRELIEVTQEVLNSSHAILKTSLITKKGDRIPYEYMGVLLKDYKGYENCICAIGRDLTERKQAEVAFQEIENKLTWITQASHDYLMMLDLNLNIQFINRTEEGLNLEDLLGKPLYLLVEEKYQTFVQSNLNKAIRENKPIYYETTYQRPEGKIIYYESIASPIVQNTQVIGLTVTSRDISVRKQIENALKLKTREHGERIKELTCLFELSKFVTDLKRSIEEVINKTKELIPPAMQYPEITCVRITYEEKLYSSSTFQETPWILSTPIMVSGKKIGSIEINYLEECPISDEDPFLKEERDLIDNLGRELGKFVERRQTENKIKFLQSVLQHNLGNKMQIVSGYLSLINESLLPEKDQEYIETALYACTEGRNLIKKISVLENMDQELLDKAKVIDLIPVIEDVVKEYTYHSSKRGMQIKFQSSMKEYKVWGGPLLRELFSNLIENYINHSKGTLLELSIKEDNSQIICMIEDNGIGIPDNKKGIIFKKGVKGELSKGSGLGLFLVNTIIDSYDGRVMVENSDLGGSKFIVVLNKV